VYVAACAVVTLRANTPAKTHPVRTTLDRTLGEMQLSDELLMLIDFPLLATKLVIIRLKKFTIFSANCVAFQPNPLRCGDFKFLAQSVNCKLQRQRDL
jgi:hypothetical protein